MTGRSVRCLIHDCRHNMWRNVVFVESAVILVYKLIILNSCSHRMLSTVYYSVCALICHLEWYIKTHTKRYRRHTINISSI